MLSLLSGLQKAFGLYTLSLGLRAVQLWCMPVQRSLSQLSLPTPSASPTKPLNQTSPACYRFLSWDYQGETDNGVLETGNSSDLAGSKEGCNVFLYVFLTPVLLKAWSLKQLHQPHLGVYYQYRISDSIPDIHTESESILLTKSPCNS